jgi:hypothetical protein
MLLLLFGAIVFIFLVLGSLVFLACAIVPPTRKYALSAALWCAVWGPCSVGLMALAGLGLVATAFFAKDGNVQSLHAPRLIAAFGWGYLIAGVLITTAVATGTAWIHQKVVRRFTFFLFRLYATAVSGGIGSVFGWCLGWWMMRKGVAHYGPFLWCIGMLILVAVFATAAYKGARKLRGKAPTSLTWISPEEFAGTDLL